MADAISIDTKKIRGLSDAVQGEVLDSLQEANTILPSLREIDQDLYTSVTPALAINYTLGTGYMHAMVKGASECFTEMSEALAESAQYWEDIEEENRKMFEE